MSLFVTVAVALEMIAFLSRTLGISTFALLFGDKYGAKSTQNESGKS